MKSISSIMILFVLTSLQAFDYKEYLSVIKNDAMVLGKGENTVHAFLDPMCHNSQNYLEMITQSQALLQNNTFYIYLYRLPKFESDALIEHIYSSKSPWNITKQIMLHKFKPKVYKMLHSETAKIIKNRISQVAQKFRVKRRPYLLIFKKGSNFCKVSEGNAPCLNPKKKNNKS